MTRSDRMQPIKDLADSRERDAGSIVAAAQTLLQEREKQLQQLRQYRDDYVAKGSADTGTVDALRLQNNRAFLQRLGDAIRHQEQLVKQAREDYERKTDAWRERRVEANSLGRAIENIQTEERKVEERREQTLLDEQSAAQRRSRELASESGVWKIGGTGSTGKWKVDKN